MTARRRSAVVITTITAVAAITLSGCGFQGLSDLPMPGAQGTDNGAYQISAMIPTAAGLNTNAPVMIDDATVGSVGRIGIKDWKADVAIRLDKGVRVPRGSHVMVGMTSVLGSSHLQIVQPENPTGGYLDAGDEIPLTKCPEQPNISPPGDSTRAVADINSAQQVAQCTYPTTEQVLSSLSVILNGGGLAQLGDIVHELNAVFTPNRGQIRALLPRLNTLVADLDRQKGNIISATEGLDRLSQNINEQTPTVQRALSDAPQILQLLVDQRPHFTGALDALARLSATTNDILDANESDIKTIVANLSKLLDQLQSTGPALTESLGLLLTFPFVEDKIPGVVRGDYVNGDLVLDLTFDRLKAGALSSVGLVGPEGITGSPAGAARRGLNPFTSPLQPGGGQPRSGTSGSTAPGSITPGSTTPGGGN